ncbi:STE3-domain-containing protein [Macrolepiota fuliginosa MF-IS2]|uniref:STE3-domain-containing protein n=1 Tax=Macrolepiota fuliginosa MF-IS2 TaxID=1400762 RepID=A0A9P6C6L1_9AGAR|nr:STE3-domain-containing protein [Macrolepiota fuliginosa MF-IS2]
MADPTYPLFSVFAFVAFVLVLIPLPWHLQAWNSGTCLYMIWTAIGCLNLFINSIVWHGNAIDWAPVWCDISTRLMTGVSVAIPAASLCINRRLYKIASCQTATVGYAQKRRAVLIDLAIGLGIPLLQMPLQFIVQGHRYDIFEDIGCMPTTVNTPVAYPLTFIWPNVIGLVSAIYCILTLRAFMQRRAQFQQFISSNSSLSISRYFRLMALATAELLFNVPITTYGLYLNITSRPIYPWKSWSDTHFAWYIIDTYPGLLWRGQKTQVVILELSRWSLVFCALVFFAFFGFADEARKNYERALSAILQKLGLSALASQSKGSSTKQSSQAKLILPISQPLKPTPDPTQCDFVSEVSMFHTSFEKTNCTSSPSYSSTDTERTLRYDFLAPTPSVSYQSPYSLPVPPLPQRPASSLF